MPLNKAATRVTAAMFVPCTPGGELIKHLQNVEDELAADLGLETRNPNCEKNYKIISYGV